MSKLTFLRIEDRGPWLVAVFDRGYPVAHYNWDNYDGRYPVARYDDGTFYLNEQSLRTRIANVERDGRSATVERAALAELVHRTQAATTSPAEREG